jgi:hypothetical protein
MKHLKTYMQLNESKQESILKKITYKLIAKGIEIKEVVDLDNSITFIYKVPFTLSLADNDKTIVVIVEKDGSTDTLGSYDIKEVDQVIDLISTY